MTPVWKSCADCVARFMTKMSAEGLIDARCFTYIPAVSRFETFALSSTKYHKNLCSDLW